jgi:mannose-6-phosphate isomerase-like protein (cupin superfamily)
MKSIALRLASAPSLAALLLAAGCASRPDPDPGTRSLPAPPPGAGYVEDIAQTTRDNEDYRRVLVTGPHMQLVLMTLRQGEEIGVETHEDGDQFIRVEAGTGRAILDGRTYPLRDGSVVVIPAGIAHNVINTGSSPLRMYFLYSPPEHPHGTVHRTKADAGH